MQNSTQNPEEQEASTQQFLELFRPYQEFVQAMHEGLKELAEVAEAPTRKSQTEAAPKQKAAAIVKPSISNKRILIVETTEVNRVLLSHYFKEFPIQLEFSSTEADAVTKCRSQKFDLILLGKATSSEIRQFEKDMPMLALDTADREDGEKRLALEKLSNEVLQLLL